MAVFGDHMFVSDSFKSSDRTMRETRRDMHHLCRRTSCGGLVVNVIEC